MLNNKPVSDAFRMIRLFSRPILTAIVLKHPIKIIRILEPVSNKIVYCKKCTVSHQICSAS